MTVVSYVLVMISYMRIIIEPKPINWTWTRQTEMDLRTLPNSQEGRRKWVGYWTTCSRLILVGGACASPLMYL